MTMKNLGKRGLALFVALLMCITMLPMSAFAEGEGLPILALQDEQPEAGKITATTVKGATAADGTWRLHPGHSLTAPIGDTSQSTINLWTYSDEMEVAGDNRDGVVPYFVHSETGEEYRLCEIRWNTISSYRDTDDKIIMTTEGISSATSKEDYLLNTSALTGGTKKYYILYLWKKEAPKPRYNVCYDFAQPEDTNWRRSVEYRSNDNSYYINQTWDTSQGFAPVTVTDQAVEDADFLPKADGEQAYGYVAYNASTNDNFWVFEGWQDKNGVLHPNGEKITASADLVGEDGKTINLTAQWRQVTKGMVIAAAPNMPTMASAVMSPRLWQNSEQGYNVISQKKPDGNLTFAPLKLDESRQVAYNLDLCTSFGASFNEGVNINLADMQVHVNMDSGLRLVPDTDGNVVFQKKHDGQVMVLTGLTVDGETIPAREDGQSITVAAEKLQGKDGTIKPFDILVKWQVVNGKASDLQMYLELPTARLVDGQESASTSVQVEGYLAYPGNQYWNWDRAKTVWVNEQVFKRADWNKYFADNNIPDRAEQFAYIMQYARLGKDEVEGSNIRFDSNVVTATETKHYTVTFNSNGGSEVEAQTVTEGKTATKPADPTREGYTFNGWHAKGATENYKFEETPVTGDITLTAQWEINKYNVTFDLNYDGAEKTEPTTVEHGKTVTAPTAPIRSGYTFTGWRAEGETENYKFETPVTSDLTLMAQWAEVPVTPPVNPPVNPDPPVTTYTVTYTDGVDGEEIFADQVTRSLSYGAATPAFQGEEPVREGYTFGGWEPEVAATVTRNATYTAIWEEEILGPDVPLIVAPGLDTLNHFAYINGYGGRLVKPQNNITRAEVATIFYRLMEDSFRSTYWTNANGFTDVNSGDWFNNAVSTSADAELVKGYPDGSFKGNKSITRAEFATIAARFLPDFEGNVEDYPDTANHWAAKEIRIVTEAGWFQGDNGKFRPNDPITRAEAMTVVNRMVNRVPKTEEDLLDGMVTWDDNNPGAWYYEAVQEATNSHNYEHGQRGDESEETWTELIPNPDWKALEKEWEAEHLGA